ncbi:MAG: protein-L-isoaspartate O-methyltransferase family protein [Pseudonocardiaceae bacterium]
MTSKGVNGDPSSSSSATPLMARMLKALDLCPGMRVLEIGAGSGYNAALITTITGAPVVTVDAGKNTAREAAESIHLLGLDDRVTVHHSNGYLGAPDEGPFDRIIVTCGIAGIPPRWFDQLTPDGTILAPITHGGVHPIFTVRPGTPPRAEARLWADFMTAAGPLGPAILFRHDPAQAIPASPLTRFPEISPALTAAEYNDLWFFLAIRDEATTRAYPADDALDLSQGMCALVDPYLGVAWTRYDGSIVTPEGQDDTLRLHLTDYTRSWHDLGKPRLSTWNCKLVTTRTANPLYLPDHRTWTS